MCELLKQVEENIEAVRMQMNRTADQQGHTSGTVLFLSQELDKLLNIYDQLKLASNNNRQRQMACHF